MGKFFSLQGPVSYTLMGLILAVVLFIAFSNYQRSSYLATPIAEIFSADVVVPNFKSGENPQVQYERAIKTTFLGSFRVEVKEITSGKTFCSGGASNILYEKGEIAPINTSLSWYVGDGCVLKIPPGQYMLVSSYVVQQEGLPNRYYVSKSNVFTVS